MLWGTASDTPQRVLKGGEEDAAHAVPQAWEFQGVARQRLLCCHHNVFRGEGCAGCVSSSKEEESSCVTDAFFWETRDAVRCVSSSKSSLEEESLKSLEKEELLAAAMAARRATSLEVALAPALAATAAACCLARRGLPRSHMYCASYRYYIVNRICVYRVRRLDK
mmetsp:Transcript_33412/g.66066  ORF Transcript_33412/g.66066 Transcript_33412/m.66066 type:complete len:166 (-) Transcript_33412:8-505(-)